MSHDLKFRATIALGCVLALAAGFFLGRPGPPIRDMLDAVAAVQRRSPLFLVSEPMPRHDWARGGALYLCRGRRTAEDMDGLGKHPWRHDPGWAGVVCFMGTADPNLHYHPWVTEGGACCLRYGTFAVFGDPELLREVQFILSAEGFRPQLVEKKASGGREPSVDAAKQDP